MRNRILAVVSGLAMSLSFPSWAVNGLDTRIGFIAWVALVPLLFAIERESRRGAFFLGWLGGMVFFSSTLYWIACIREMEYMAVPGWLAASAFLGIFWGIWAWGVAAAGTRSWLAGPALWVLLEWLRGHLLTGFPWAITGTTQWAFPQVFLSARYAGVLGVSFAVVSFNTAAWKIRFPRPLRIPAVVLAVFSIGALAVLSFAARFSLRSGLTGPDAVKVAILQGNFTEAEKWSLPMEIMVGRYEELARQAGREGARITVWPETATAGELSHDPATMARLVRLVKKTGSIQLVGAILLENGRYFNAAYLATGSEVTVRYRKNHLVPFGEYIPGYVRTLLPFARKLTEGVVDYSAGASVEPSKTGLMNAGIQVCYESIFPDISRSQANSGAEIFVNLTNDAWYLRTAATFQHALGPIARSVENGKWMVRCANTGLSFFCGPDGRPHASLGVFQTGFQVMAVKPSAGATWYARWGDVPLMILALLALALAFIPAGGKALKSA